MLIGPVPSPLFVTDSAVKYGIDGGEKIFKLYLLIHNTPVNFTSGTFNITIKGNRKVQNNFSNK